MFKASCLYFSFHQHLIAHILLLLQLPFFQMMQDHLVPIPIPKKKLFHVCQHCTAVWYQGEIPLLTTILLIFMWWYRWRDWIKPDPTFCGFLVIKMMNAPWFYLLPGGVNNLCILRLTKLYIFSQNLCMYTVIKITAAGIFNCDGILSIHSCWICS